MFGNLNKLITKITSDKTRGGGGGSPSASQGSPSHVTQDADNDEEETAEGFLCPRCMENFVSPEELESHYESAHSELLQHVCPICKEKFPTGDQLQIHYASDHASSGVQTLNGDLQVLRNELAEMKTTLKEERWYSEELKKEVTRLGGVVEREETQETISMKQQLKSLEEAKSLLTSEIVLLRKQLGEAVETHLLMKQQKENLEQKMGLFSTEKASLLSQIDEERSLRQSIEKDFEDLKVTKRSLEAQLNAKHGDDEVRSLRHQLEAAKGEHEKERAELLNQKKTLEQSVDEFMMRITDRESKLNELVVQLDTLTKELDAVKEDKESALIQNKELQLEFDGLSLEISQMKSENVKDVDAVLKLEQLSEKLQVELENVRKLNGDCEAQCSELKNKLNEAEERFQNERQDFHLQQENSLTVRNSLESKIDHLNKDLTEKRLQIEKLLADEQDKDGRVKDVEIQLKDLQSELKDLNCAFDEVKLQLLDARMELEKETRLKQQLADGAAELKVQLEQQAALVERLNQEREELYSKIEAGEGIDAAIQQLQMENAGLAERISDQQKAAAAEAKESTQKIDDLYSNLLETKKQLQISREKVSKLENVTEEMTTKLNVSEDKRQQLEQSLSEKLRDFGTKENGWALSKLELEKQLRDTEEKLTVSDQTLSKSRDDCASLKTQMAEMNEQLYRKSLTVDELKADVNSAKRKCDQLSENLEIKEVEWKEQICNVENIRSSLQQEVAHLTIEKSISDGELMRTRNVVEKQAHLLLNSVNETRETVLVLKSKCLALQDMFNTDSKHLEAKFSCLVTALSTTYQQLNAKTKSESDLQARLNELNGIMPGLKTEIECSKRSIEEANNERDEWRRRQQLAESSLNERASECDLLRKQLTTTEASLKESEHQVEQLQTQLKEAVVIAEQLRANEEKLQKQLGESDEARKTLAERLKVSATDVASALDAQQKLNLQKTSLETELFDTQKAFSDLEEKFSNVEVANSDLENRLISTRVDLQSQIVKLEEARDFLIAQKLELCTKLTSSEAELQQEKETIEKMRKDNSHIVEGLHNDISALKSELEETLESKRAVEVDAEQSRARFEMQVATLQENLATMRGDVTAHQDKVKQLEARTDEILGEKLEMEAKLENAIDERRALLERCLSSEADCEKLRTSASELRRKLDDALSALHELGRENQTLQMETAKLSSRKWTDDSETDSCTSCQKQFSVTFRKHHCRNCGNIYCNECSSKTATITAYKKPVRVCDGCFNEISK